MPDKSAATCTEKRIKRLLFPLAAEIIFTIRLPNSIFSQSNLRDNANLTLCKMDLTDGSLVKYYSQEMVRSGECRAKRSMHPVRYAERFKVPRKSHPL